jgi:hypothetical protein
VGEGASIMPRPATAHYTNRLHDVWLGDQHFIAKEFLDESDPEAAEREYGALHVLKRLDVAPRPVFFDPERRVVLYEFLDGLEFF